MKNINRALKALIILLLIVLMVMPIFCILLTSVHSNGKLDIFAFLGNLFTDEIRKTFVNTMILGVLVVLITTIIAMPLAFIMTKTQLGKHKWLEIVLMIPFMTPPYIASMGWILFMQPNGYWDQFIKLPIKLNDHFFNLFGMVMVMSLQVFPFLYLILKNALVKISRSKEEAAYVHGGRSFYTFRKVTLPLLISSYSIGALLVFVKTISEFGTPVTFGKRISYFVLTTEIHQYVSSWPIDFGKATALASMLLTTCLCLWYISSVINNRYSYNLVSGKGAGEKTYNLPRLKKALAWFYIIFLLLISIGIPYFSVLIASVMKLRSGGLSINNLTFDYYIKLLSTNSDGLKALLTSLGLAFIATCICVILGTTFAISVNKSKRVSEKLIDFFSLLPNTIPGIVMVVGLILFWNSKWMPIPIYNTYGMVVLTYVILFIPYTVQYVKASYIQMDESLFNAGKVFGGKSHYILRRITLPLLVPGMLAGWMMTFIISIRELVAALMILPPSMETASTYIYSEFEQGNLSLGMAMAIICVIITVIMLLVINKLSDRFKLGGNIS